MRVGVPRHANAASAVVVAPPRYAMRCPFQSIIPSKAAPPTVIIDQGEGSGTGVTASATGSVSPWIKLALIALPVVASYWPTAPAPGVAPPKSATKRLLPETASP
jgi:hypothetical protein